MSERTFTEKEHEALVTDAVRREVATATESKDSRITELEGQIDVLESEKAALEQGKTDAEKALEDYKNEQERAKEIASKREARKKAIQEVSAHLPDSYFTDERVSRWAEMADEDFDSLVETQAETSISALPAEEAKQFEGLEGEARLAKLVEVVTQRREAAGEKSSVTRETAAFSGGVQPTERETAGDNEPTVLSKWLATRHESKTG